MIWTIGSLWEHWFCDGLGSHMFIRKTVSDKIQPLRLIPIEPRQAKVCKRPSDDLHDVGGILIYDITYLSNLKVSQFRVFFLIRESMTSFNAPRVSDCGLKT